MSVDSNNLIYGLTDPRNGEYHYVGKSTSGLKRPKTHFCPSQYNKKKTKLQRWIHSLSLVGLKPDIEILQNCMLESINDEEKFYILYLRFLGFDLCNHTEGGDGVNKADESVLVKIREARARQVFSEETKQKMRLAKLGTKHSDEHKANIAKSATGRKIAVNRTEEQKKALHDKLSSIRIGKPRGPQSLEQVRNRVLAHPLLRPVIDNFGVKYESVMAAARALNVSGPAIYNNLAGRSKFVRKTYTFQYLGEVSLVR